MAELNEYVVRAHELHHDGEVLLTGAILLLTARQAAPLLAIEAIEAIEAKPAGAVPIIPPAAADAAGLNLTAAGTPEGAGAGQALDATVSEADDRAVVAPVADAATGLQPLSDAQPVTGAMDDGAGAAGGQKGKLR